MQTAFSRTRVRGNGKRLASHKSQQPVRTAPFVPSIGCSCELEQRHVLDIVWSPKEKSGADSGWDAAGSEKPGGWGMGDTGRAYSLPQGCCADATVDAASGFFSRATQRFGFSADWRLRKV
jgi:hypothetical protein